MYYSMGRLYDMDDITMHRDKDNILLIHDRYITPVNWLEYFISHAYTDEKETMSFDVLADQKSADALERAGSVIPLSAGYYGVTKDKKDEFCNVVLKELSRLQHKPQERILFLLGWDRAIEEIPRVSQAIFVDLLEEAKKTETSIVCLASERCDCGQMLRLADWTVFATIATSSIIEEEVLGMSMTLSDVNTVSWRFNDSAARSYVIPKEDK